MADEICEEFMAGVARRNRGESEFQQAVAEVATNIIPYIETRPDYKEARILERLTEADRIISFRVVWEDDNFLVGQPSETILQIILQKIQLTTIMYIKL